VILSLLFACQTETLGGDSGGLEGNDPGDTAGDTADTAEDTASGDTGGDTDSGTDTGVDTGDTSDTGGDTDTVDTDPSNDVNPDDLVGRVYDFSINHATISPSGLGSVLSGQINQDFLLEVEAADSTSIDFLAGLSVADDPTTQDYCVQTISMTGGSFAGNPSFSIGPADLSLNVAGTDVTLSNVTISGTFTDDLSQIKAGELDALIDSRPIDASLGQPDGTVCGYGSVFGFTCEACPDGEEYCIAFSATKVTADQLETTDVIEVAGTNCEGCEDGPPAADAVCY